jgi:hypothetical protein
VDVSSFSYVLLLVTLFNQAATDGFGKAARGVTFFSAGSRPQEFVADVSPSRTNRTGSCQDRGQSCRLARRPPQVVSYILT